MTKEATLWDRIETVLSNAPGKRPKEDINRLLPWFHDRSSLFKNLDDESLSNVVQNVKLIRYRGDFVLLHQGEIGNCFYILLRGTVSVYAKRDEELESANEPVAKEIFNAKGTKDRAKFGNELGILDCGRCFGEFCVLGPNRRRNASIISNEPTVVISVERHVYSKYVPESFAAELLGKSAFVGTCSMFKKWPSTYRNLLAESLQVRKVPFGECLYRQGDEAVSLYFIIKGQLEVTMNPNIHRNQYQKLFIKRPSNDPSLQRDRSLPSDPYCDLQLAQRREEKEKLGYQAAEQRTRPQIHICALAYPGIAGDLEVVFDLPTYASTARCVNELTVYELDKGSFVRIIGRKNPETYQAMEESIKTKIQFRNDSIKNGIPLYRWLIDGTKSQNNKEDDRARVRMQMTVIKTKKRLSRLETSGVTPNMMRSRRMSRMQQTKVNINPVTGEVTIISTGPSRDQTKRASQEWESNRRRFSVSTSSNQRDSLSGLSNALPNNLAMGNQLGSISEEVSENSCGDKKAFPVTVGVARGAVKFKQRRRKKSQQGEGKQKSSMEEYRNLRRKMQAMNKTTHNTATWPAD